MNRNKNLLLMTFIFLIVLFSINSAAAEEISLAEAVERGLDNNLEIRQEKNKIASLERELKTIRAQQGWQIELSANYNEVIEEGEIAQRIPSGSASSDSLEQGGNSSLSISRNFSSGLNLSQTAEIDDEGESDYQINISYPLFTGVPTESERSYYQQEQELLKAKNNLDSLIEDKISDWVESYLQLMRLEQSRDNVELNLNTAQKNLTEKEELYSQKQISETELNNAEAELLDAENNYLELKNQYQNAFKSFKLELEISENTSLDFEESEYLKDLRSQLLEHQNYEFDKLYQTMLNSDYDLQSALINLTLQEKQLQWFQDEGKADINLSGSYDHSTERSVVGVTFSYDLFNGGQREFNEENLKDNLELAQANLENLKENKKIALESQLNQIYAAENRLQSADLKFKNAKKQLNLAEAQLESGLISEKEFRQQQFSYQQSKNNYQQAAD
ncbi:MAG: TolC family protein, partial [Halanaerobium sp.]